MPFRALILLGFIISTVVPAAEEDYKVYTESPRLLLNSKRLRLLRREKERASLRWDQFNQLMSGGAAMPEPGFANALYGQITQTPEPCQKALQNPGADLRQLALVADWCNSAEKLAPKLEPALTMPVNAIPAARDAAFAALALGDLKPDAAAKTLSRLVDTWWRNGLALQLKQNGVIPRQDVYALMEFLHVIRDNFNQDLRDDAPAFFKELPVFHLLSYYPTPFPAAENEYHIPFFTTDGDPDLTYAQISRAADMSMVAFDTNMPENQFLQGWVMQDRFLMRGAFGIPYEFLWANPYQPGLSFHYMPNLFHDKRTGRLFVRSNWEEDATYFCLYEGQVQFFSEGKRKVMRLKTGIEPIHVGAVTVLYTSAPVKFMVEPSEEKQTYFLVGLDAGKAHEIEIDDQELTDDRTDQGGILSLAFPKSARPSGIRLKLAQPPAFSPAVLLPPAPAASR